MPRSIKLILLTALLAFAAVDCFAQSTTGTVSMSATVSKFVEINSGGPVTLAGNSGGGVTTDGVSNSPLAVSINLGELGPSNTNNFVTALVPLKLRSNASYVLSMSMVATEDFVVRHLRTSFAGKGSCCHFGSVQLSQVPS